MGAGVSLTVAQLAPERVRGLVLSRPAWLDAPMPPNLAIFPVVAGLIRTYGAQRGLRASRRSTHTSNYWPQRQMLPRPCADNLPTRVRRRRSPSWSACRHDAPAGSQAGWAGIRAPTLILANRTDPPHPFEYGELLAATLPNAELVEITSKSVDKALHVRQAREAIAGFLGKTTW